MAVEQLKQEKVELEGKITFLLREINDQHQKASLSSAYLHQNYLRSWSVHSRPLDVDVSLFLSSSASERFQNIGGRAAILGLLLHLMASQSQATGGIPPSPKDKTDTPPPEDSQQSSGGRIE
jgi:hypothetical protein